MTVAPRQKLAAEPEYIRTATLVRDFLESSHQVPDRVALRGSSAELTYRELAAAVDQLSTVDSALTRLPPGAVVACSLADPLSIVALLYACAQRGLVLGPLDPRLKSAERRRLLELAQPALLLDTDAMAKLLRADGEPSRPRPEVSGETLFYLGFTSGSTGRPKGVLRTQASWALSFRAMTAEFGLSQQHQVLLGGSLAHSFFLTGALHGLSIGAEVICLDKFSPGRLIAAARRSRATVLYLVPTMSRRLADRLEREPPLDSIQVVIAAGARWLPADRRRLQELLPWARLIEYYGSSEMGFVSISTPAKFEAEPQSVGRIFSGVEVEIRDDEGRFCGPNQLGTIHARGPLACAGLLGEAAELASPSSPAWLSSGDRGYLDERGCLFLVGREDEQINVGGLKLFAPEIEREILGHPDVSAAIVLGLDDPLQGQVVGALVESRAGRRPLESEILAWLRPRLSSHKLPRRLLVVSRLPRTPNGKAARARARALLSASNPTTGAP